MDELISKLLIQPPTEAENEYFTAFIANIENGPILFELLQSQNKNFENRQFLFSLLGLFENWVSTHYKELDQETRNIIFSLLENPMISLNKSNFYVRLITRDRNSSIYYDPFLSFALSQIMTESFTIQQVSDLTSIIYAIAHPYFHKRAQIEEDQEILNVEEVFEQFIATLFPYLESQDVLVDESGADLLHNILMGFLGLFKRIEPDLSVIDLPLQFSMNTIGLIQNPEIKINHKVIAEAISFLNNLFSINALNEILQEPRTNFIDLLIQTLAYVVSNCKEDFNLLHTILFGLYKMEKYIDISSSSIFELILNCCELSDSEKNNFNDNPILFYESIYSEDESNDWPIQIAHSLVLHFVEGNSEAASSLLQMEPTEFSRRIVGYCASLYESIHHEEENLIEWVKNANSELITDNEIELFSQLYLFTQTIELMDIEDQSDIKDLIPPLLIHTNFKSPLIPLQVSILFKLLLENDISPEPETIDNLINLIPHINRKEPVETLAYLCKVLPAQMIQRGQAIFFSIMDYFGQELEKGLDSEEFDESNDLFKECHAVLVLLIKHIGRTLVSEPVLNLIKDILNSSHEELYDSCFDLCEEIVESESQYVPDVFNIVIDAFNTNSVIFPYIDSFGKVVVKQISKNNELFCEMHFSPAIIQICLNLVKNDISTMEVRVVGLIITWIILADRSFNIEEIPNLIEFVSYICSTYEERSASCHMAAMQIVASIALTREIFIIEDSVPRIIKLIKENYCYRPFDCDLFILFLIQFIQSGNCTANGEIMGYIFTLFDSKKKWEQSNEQQREEIEEETGFSEEYKFYIGEDLESPLSMFDMRPGLEAIQGVLTKGELIKLHHSFPHYFVSSE